MFTKALLAFLIFSIFSAQAMIGDGWTPFASSNMNRDPDIHKIMTTGIMSFVSKASQQNAIKSTDWTLQKVNSIDVQVTDSVKYRLNLALKNTENKQMNVVLIVNKDASTNEIKLLSWEIVNSPPQGKQKFLQNL